ncbi:MAG: putative acetyltransferase [Friedmanniella sp.]|nr:putative acetyltransferase [Friedmanniella sp.]
MPVLRGDPARGDGRWGRHHGEVTTTVRRLGPQDAPAIRRLGEEAFGVPSTPATEPLTVVAADRTRFGAFDGDRLVAQSTDRHFDSWMGGRPIPTSGIAGVTVGAEDRGRGGLGPLFGAMLEAARDRGAVLSTLFPTAPRIYRRFGYELVGSYDTVAVPTAALASVPRPAGVLTRRAEVGDVAAVREVYDTWAAAQNGPLTRRGVSFNESEADYLARFTGVTLAVEEGRTVGYAAWHRGQGYGEQATLEVQDLVALTAEAYAALLAVLGSFASVTGTTTIATSGADPVRLFLPGLAWSGVGASAYMLRVLDPVAAFRLRSWAPGLRVQLGFTLRGDALPGNDGGYRIAVADGRAVVERRPGGPVPGERVLTARGLALAYAGAQSSANLRFAGLLSGGRVVEDQDWDALLGGRQVHIRNYF